MVDKKLMEEIRQEELAYMKDTLKLTEAEALKFMESHDNFTLELGKLKQVEVAITIMITTAAALALHRNVSPQNFFELVKGVVLECALTHATAPEDDAQDGLNIVTWQKVGEA